MPGGLRGLNFLEDLLLKPRVNIRPARNLIVLCGGLGGFWNFFKHTFGPHHETYDLIMWKEAIRQLTSIGAQCMAIKAPRDEQIVERANWIHDILNKTLEKNTQVNFVAHSMGGLDCRYLITHIKPTHYRPVSLTTLGCPHIGSSFMDWCWENLGLGDLKFANFKPSTNKAINDIQGSKFRLYGATHFLDSKSYSNLRTRFLKEQFNPVTPDDPGVSYYSIAGYISDSRPLPLWHPLHFSHRIVSKTEGPINDGLVSLQSARWGNFLGLIDCNHWQLRQIATPSSETQFGEPSPPNQFLRHLSTILYENGF